MVKYCPVCHEDNLSNARFCSSCGSVIAHIEATFSGLGTADRGGPASSSALTAAPQLRTPADTGLADQMVAISEARQVSQGRGSPGRFWRNPKAVAGLAAFTVVALTMSLVWIIQGQQPLGVKGLGQPTMKQGLSNPDPLATTEPASRPSALPISVVRPEATDVRPIETQPALPAKKLPQAVVLVQPQVLPSSVAKPKEPLVKRSLQNDANQKDSKQRDAKQRDAKQRDANHKEPGTKAIKQAAAPESVQADSATIVPLTKLAVSSDAASRDDARLGSKNVQRSNNVEALCAERTNFLSRGYCQNQYCAEVQRKGDPTCQRLRQYELARQTINY
jgi:hypothetical protein